MINAIEPSFVALTPLKRKKKASNFQFLYMWFCHPKVKKKIMLMVMVSVTDGTKSCRSGTTGDITLDG